ncbi:glycosyltransferase family 2 protein [Curtobacterium sp. ER1/6]|uniref:glycosyltransferase family 2 protein n=1 Tax=Curtobacterium sp. ER1/6 TaxID=1891920 RepID=UPI00084FA6B7|nr:glycosyltransferase family 2 protein [Curtobacterium sp. ER1/6]
MTTSGNRRSPLPIVAIVLTKNEEAQINSTLSRLKNFAEIVVVDSHSDDSTVEIAKEHGARVLQFTWNGTYPKKKQWSLENATAGHEWVLLLDADETPTPALLDELRSIVADPDAHSAYDVPLLYRFSGKVLRHGHRVTKRSLLRVGHARFPDVGDEDLPGIREVEGHYQPEVDGPVGKVKSPILHDDRDPVSSWFDRHNRYSDWEAHLRSRPGLRQAIAGRRSKQGQLFDRVPFKPGAFFAYSFLARGGFLDGRAGFDYAFALASYYWQIGLKVRELETAERDDRD